jgi:hypothetical protein
MGIDCKLHCVDHLHAFGMVDLSAAGSVVAKDANRAIKRSSGKLSARRCIVDIGDGSYMTLMDRLSAVHASEVEGVAVRIVVADREIDGLQRVEGNAHCLVW